MDNFNSAEERRRRKKRYLILSLPFFGDNAVKVL